MTETNGNDRFRNVVYGIAAAATIAYTGWLGSAMLTVGERLTRIETTIVESRAERLQQITNLDRQSTALERRVERIEDAMGGRFRFERESER